MTTPPELLPVHQENSVAARVGRRRDFRRMFTLAPEARGYIPRPYENALTGDTYIEPIGASLPGDDLITLLDHIEAAGDGDRAGDALSDPT
ncbi:hypothetical protein GCM10023403_10200 [Pseudonocardia benzenivorans]